MKHYPPEIKKQAQRLRARGYTYQKIASMLGVVVPKSTLSCWCKNMVMSAQYQRTMKTMNARHLLSIRKLALVANKLKQDRILEHIHTAYAHLPTLLHNKDVLKMLLAMLYLGEGSKWKSHRGLMLGSSDPLIIRLYIQLLKLCYDVPSNQIKCRISYRVDQDIKELQKILGEGDRHPVSQFLQNDS